MPAEAEVKVRKFIDDIQDEMLTNFTRDWGTGPNDLAAELARQRAEHVRWREQAIERMRAMAVHWRWWRAALSSPGFLFSGVDR